MEEIILSAARRDGQIEFRQEKTGNIIASAPSSEDLKEALLPHIPSHVDLSNVGIGISFQHRPNQSFSQPMCRVKFDDLDENLFEDHIHKSHFVFQIDSGGAAGYQDIEIGDEIWSVNGTMIREMSHQDVEDLIYGPVGTQVHLVIMRYEKFTKRLVIGTATTERRELVKSHAVILGRWPHGFVPVCSFNDPLDLGLTFVRCSNGRTYLLSLRRPPGDDPVSKAAAAAVDAAERRMAAGDRLLLVNGQRVDGRTVAEAQELFRARRDESMGAGRPDRRVALRLQSAGGARGSGDTGPPDVKAGTVVEVLLGVEEGLGRDPPAMMLAAPTTCQLAVASLGLSFSVDLATAVVRVTAVEPGGPAAETGLVLPGDEVLSVNGSPIPDLALQVVQAGRRIGSYNIDALIERLDGRDGTHALLELLRLTLDAPPPNASSTNPSLPHPTESAASTTGALVAVGCTDGGGSGNGGIVSGRRGGKRAYKGPEGAVVSPWTDVAAAVMEPLFTGALLTKGIESMSYLFSERAITTKVAGDLLPKLFVSILRRSHRSAPLRPLTLFQRQSIPLPSPVLLQPDAIERGLELVDLSKLGLFLARHVQSRDWLVHRVLAGGPSWRTGRVQAGDSLLSADGVLVVGHDAARVADLLDGPDGSAVSLCLRAAGRRRDAVPGQTLVVRVVRWRRQRADASLLA